MIAISADIAMGGKDDLVIGSLHEDLWFSPLDAIRGVDVKSPPQVAQEITKRRRNGADTSVDLTGGWGSGVKSHLEQDQDIPCHGIVYSEKSGARTYDDRFGFLNLRAEMYVKFKEALDPEGPAGEPIMLPDDPRVLAELTAPRWILKGTNIQIESKDDIRARLGSSTDRADVIVMLWFRRHYAALLSLGKQPRGGWAEIVPDDDLL